MQLERNSILSPKKGCFPEGSRDRLSWRIYGDGLKYLLEEPDYWFSDSLVLEHTRKEAIKNLKELDRTLELIRNYNTLNDSDPWTKLFIDDNKFPERTDIHVKFFELTKEYIINTGIINKKVKDENEYETEYYKIQYNLIMDCRRVIDYVLNDKPLYLIPEQARIFRKFADKLSVPREENPYLSLEI